MLHFLYVFVTLEMDLKGEKSSQLMTNPYNCKISTENVFNFRYRPACKLLTEQLWGNSSLHCFACMGYIKQSHHHRVNYKSQHIWPACFFFSLHGPQIKVELYGEKENKKKINCGVIALFAKAHLLGHTFFEQITNWPLLYTVCVSWDVTTRHYVAAHRGWRCLGEGVVVWWE